MTYETLRYELTDDHVATITLDRPEALNAFNQKMCEEFRSVWATVRSDDAVHAVVLQGGGDRAFNSLFGCERYIAHHLTGGGVVDGLGARGVGNGGAVNKVAQGAESHLHVPSFACGGVSRQVGVLRKSG